MTAAGVVALKFVVNSCGSTELFFKTICSHKRGRTIHLIKVSDIFGDIEICSIVVKFLTDEFFTEYTCEFLSFHRLVGPWV